MNNSLSAHRHLLVKKSGIRLLSDCSQQHSPHFCFYVVVVFMSTYPV